MVTPLSVFVEMQHLVVGDVDDVIVNEIVVFVARMVAARLARTHVFDDVNRFSE